ncbi:MAG: energy transducer TonB [Acidobacteria bacterium]|nr:energy transducer TonB [Acidobacteriota bacterium]MBV9186908.1 energy transducer TonB [Acidobacteriota bacterium]
MFRRTTQALLFLCILPIARAQESDTPTVPLRKLPTDVILVKGAVPSASDTSTPLPEGGVVAKDVYNNDYFGLSYALPSGWFEKYKGPPPSDSGAYVLTLLRPGPTDKHSSRGTLLITAQDMFFTRLPGQTAKETIEQTKETLQPDYKVEHAPSQVTVANHAFTRFDYNSPVAGLHWYVLATEVRCHTVRFVFTSPDPALIETLIKEMDAMKLADANAPLCVAGYAEAANSITYKVDPTWTEQKYNAIPVRIIIDKAGKVRHVHVISAFPAQAKAITDALMTWRFRPYLRDGQPVDVETGIMFGSAPRAKASAATSVNARRSSD